LETLNCDLLNVPEKADVSIHILTSANFLIGELLLDMLIQFAVILYIKAKAIKAIVHASIGGIMGIFFIRYDLVHDTLVYLMQKLKIKEYQPDTSWIAYFPSSTEWAISVGAIGITLSLYYIGENFLFLDTK